MKKFKKIVATTICAVLMLSNAQSFATDGGPVPVASRAKVKVVITDSYKLDRQNELAELVKAEK